MLRTILYALFLTLSIPGWAYEVDNFTSRYQPLSDSKKILNHPINRFFSDLEAQLIPYNCDQKEFVHQQILLQMELWLKDDQELFAEGSKKIDKHPAGDNHIYAKRPLGDKISGLAMTAAGVNSSINIHGHYVGTDKIGHFFNDGLNEFKIFKKEKSEQAGLKAALASGRLLEEGALGVGLTGILSYADMVANYEGLQFWRNLTSGPDPYFQCVNGQWKNKRPFDFADYVNAGWDEGINCNDYRTKSLKKTVKDQIQILEATAKNAKNNLPDQAGISDGKISYTCPISAKACTQLKIKYKELAPQLLHPACLKAQPSSEDKAFSAQSPGAVPQKTKPLPRPTGPGAK